MPSTRKARVDKGDSHDWFFHGEKAGDRQRSPEELLPPVRVHDGSITEYQVNMMVTFVIED